MNKTDLANFVSDSVGISKKDSKEIVAATLDGIVEGLMEDGKVSLAGFGSFVLSRKDARTARNPQNGEPVEVPAKTVVKFKPASALKDAVVDVVLIEEPLDEE